MTEDMNVELSILEFMNKEVELIHRFHDTLEWHKPTTINPFEPWCHEVLEDMHFIVLM